MKRCGKRFGRKRRVCVRLAGHQGRHSVKASDYELRLLFGVSA
jgi:hypothetical protein